MQKPLQQNPIANPKLIETFEAYTRYFKQFTEEKLYSGTSTNVSSLV